MGLSGWQAAECISNETYNSLTISRLSLRKENQKLVLLANHTWDEQAISLPDTLALSAWFWVLDETTTPASMLSGELPLLRVLNSRILLLKPFAIVGILYAH